MPSSFCPIERHARLVMAGLALLALAVLLLFKTQLIQSRPSFDAYGWYEVSTVSAGLTLTRRADSEAACREKSRLPAVSCLQGKSLNTASFAPFRMH